MTMRKDPSRIIFVSGFSAALRARDLAWEFERFGRLVRCDIPALKSVNSTPYAFVEFCRANDAEDAYLDMHGRKIDGYRVTVDWARQGPRSGSTYTAAPPRSPPSRRQTYADDDDYLPPHAHSSRYASPPPSRAPPSTHERSSSSYTRTSGSGSGNGGGDNRRSGRYERERGAEYEDVRGGKGWDERGRGRGEYEDEDEWDEPRRRSESPGSRRSGR